jgi:hypothetical protein
VSQDIDEVLHSWEYRPRAVQARLVIAGDGREVLQLRVDLGVLQLEKQGRPDGQRPGGFATCYEQLRHLAEEARGRGENLVLTEEQCQEADREFLQFYHRRLAWLALANHARALADADHTLAFMDLIRDHSPSDEYTQAHEQYRAFVLFHRTQAAAALILDQGNPEKAIDEVRAGLDRIRQFFAAYEAEEQMEEDGMVQHLRRLEQSIRDQHGIGATLQEQLAQAIAREDYELAARLRDSLRRRGEAPESRQ